MTQITKTLNTSTGDIQSLKNKQFLNLIVANFNSSLHDSEQSKADLQRRAISAQPHYILLSRNLFYTGLTRAKRLAVVIGASKTIGFTVKQLKEQLRYTRLQERLRSRSVTKDDNRRNEQGRVTAMLEELL